MNYLILKMAGSGTRFGEKIPKQFQIVNGMPIFCHILKEYINVDIVDGYILVTNEDWIDYTYKQAIKILGNKLKGVVKGGNTGAESIKNGILFASSFVKDNDIVLLHDASNVIVVKNRIKDVIDACKETGFATLATEQLHALYSKDKNGYVESTIDKKQVCSGYSPEAYIFHFIYDCYATATQEELEKATAAVSLAQWHNAKVKVVEDSFVNLKITYKDDLEVFKKITKQF